MESVLERIHPEDRNLALQKIEYATHQRTGFDIEYRLMRPDGSVKYLHVVARALAPSSGDLEFVGAVTDITERKQAEEALRQAQADIARINRPATMGELAASLAHDVSQPISAAVINAYACLRWLGRDQPNLEEARAAARRIAEDGELASKIISRIRSQFNKETLQR